MADSRLRSISIVLAVVGLLDSFYLTWIKLANQYAICGPIGDCESVNSSPYAEIAGIPIALFGAGAYLMILVFLILEQRNGFWSEFSTIFVFGLSLVGVLYSIYLTYLELFVIRAICPYCVLSAVVLVVLLSISILRLVRNPGEESLFSPE